MVGTAGPCFRNGAGGRKWVVGSSEHVIFSSFFAGFICSVGGRDYPVMPNEVGRVNHRTAEGKILIEA
jgi:hypothetical protein